MVSTLLTPDRINISDDLGNSVIHVALQERVSTEIIKTIISSGARINAVDSNGKTSLRLAMDLELWEAVKLIADAGADPFLTAVDNKTPAELSFVKGETSIRSLFSGKAVNARDNSGNTILHLAAQMGNPESINLLVELGANKTIRNISSDLPYDVAVRWNRGEIAEMLR